PRTDQVGPPARARHIGQLLRRRGQGRGPEARTQEEGPQRTRAAHADDDTTRRAAAGPARLLAAPGQVLGPHEDLAGLGAVAGADDPVLLHHVDEARGLRVAEAHAALEERDGRLVLADHEVHGVPVEVIALGGVALDDVLLARQHDLLVDGRALAPEEVAHRADLLVGDPRAVHAHLL